MKKEDISRLFSGMVDNPSQDTEAVRDIFSALVRSTLRYRDHILESKGIVITVEDVQTALDWLVPALKTGRFPETDDKTRLDLLKLWLDELRTLGNALLRSLPP